MFYANDLTVHHQMYIVSRKVKLLQYIIFMESFTSYEPCQLYFKNPLSQMNNRVSNFFTLTHVHNSKVYIQIFVALQIVLYFETLCKT